MAVTVNSDVPLPSPPPSKVNRDMENYVLDAKMSSFTCLPMKQLTMPYVLTWSCPEPIYCKIGQTLPEMGGNPCRPIGWNL
jgi:hypothetical protein